MANKKNNSTARRGKATEKRMKKSTYRFFKFLFILFTVIVALILAAVAVWYGFFGRFQQADDPENHSNPGMDAVIEKDNADVKEQDQIDMINGLKGSTTLDKTLREWAKNNTENSYMHDSDVINFLLVGSDRGDNNTDVMMLVSLNQMTKKIILTSIMRDSYTYINTSDGGYCSKINAAYSGGGIRALLETVQNNYKIRIDNYVKVEFETFVEIVDIVGGVDMPLKDYEIREMARIAVSAEEKSAAAKLTAGDSVHLDGTSALLFCRIRKCYALGDVQRTMNQRKFISTLIQEFGSIGTSQVSKLVNTLLKYVKTDCSATDILSLATKALMNKWYEYELVSQVFPTEKNRMDYMGQAWIWVVDYPADAVDLQMSIYGKTNIVLRDDRVTAIDIMRGQ